ncbi:MAG: hypothetical protein DHS20C18_10250 [Saprospiraceae bacterium]|nr:MAG: hypothetical protein DHS20C18_10250 [Saprospiraceae bacterium]
MRMFSFFFLVTISLLFTACDSDTGSSSGQTGTDTTEQTGDSTTFNNAEREATPNHNCQVEGEVLEGNQFWIRDTETLIVIKADSTTNDPDFGPSHRILEVYNTQDCSLTFREVLPVNVSPDFAYFLAQILYNKNSQLVGIRGFGTIYCYDVENKRLLAALTPKFQSERFAEDAQSGMIQRLEVWEDYLIGYSQDKGTFVFNLRDKNKPEAVLPFSELPLTETDFTSLFMLPSAGGGVQAILPEYDANTGEFAINPLLDKPTDLEINIPKSARNNRFLVIRSKTEGQTPLAIDMKTFKRIDLPANVATQKTQEILSWMRGNVN